MKKLLSTRITALLLASIMTAAAIITTSCGNSGNDTADTTNTETTAETQEETTEQNRATTPDTLPEGLDFNGDKMTIFCRSDSPWYEEIFSEGQNGEIVNDAVYNRNRSVEERLNVTLNIVAEPGIHGNEGTFNNKIRSSVLAGDGAYDLIAGYAFFVTPLATEGLFLNVNDLNYLDFSQPWWSQSLADELNIDGKLYFMAGDFSLTMIKSLFVMFFNQRLQSEWNIENLYQTVIDGKWTIDKITELAKLVSKDLNGDSKYDDNDLFAIGMTTGNYIDAFLASFDQPVTKKNADGIPELALNTPKMVEMVEKTYALLCENNGAYALAESVESEATMNQMFNEGKLLILPGQLRVSEELRDMQDGYGILPYPKWNEAQEKYHTAAQDAYSLFCIPKTVKNPDMIAAVCEAMSSESYRTVTPAFYDIALKGKYIGDDLSSQMLDIARDGVVFNFGFVNASSMEWVSHIYRGLITNKNKDFASTYEKDSKKYQAALEKLVAAYQAL